jgi:hypothetical protein
MEGPLSMINLFFLAWQHVAMRLRNEPDRGDVPGWVLVTLMTAGIVTALWVVAEPSLRGLLNNALSISGDPSK